MKRRSLMTTVAALAVMMGSLGAALAQDVLKFGAAAPKTGPLAGGADVTHWPAVRLWVEQTNAAGGLQLADGPALIELIEYDDQTNPQQAIQAAQRMATQDRVDFMVAPYSTGLNLAAAPIFSQLGYPQITGSNVTNQQPELSAQFPGMFFVLGRTSVMAEDTAQVLVDLREAGDIGNRVALVNVADAFGIEMAGISRAVLEENGFEIVYQTSYPLGTQDIAPIIDGAKAANPDAFIAWSYPGDTFALTDQAIVQDFSPSVFFTAVATAFPSYYGRFGQQAEGVLGMGGVNPDDPAFQAFATAHEDLSGQGPDFWASASTYATLEILGQAIEATGSRDRAVVMEYLQDSSNSYETVLGPVQFNDMNDNERYWTVGQWQDGVFRGVAARGRDGVSDVVLKDGWD
ncbi:amino acid ABC transporter substrate-binding protein [Roseinatronobacter sp. S2]|uniref:amino acid ABC transporter substrate-binding protein n=1 Tax=Roseinatronobacter sp. S2 TaxID=3035471 RepID=UPI00240FA820|nr:amino acid ABC transporter substrate-binding protein [Roseinatronobacter sp. S2]WFE75411.1 amino acid ABC transporter substrate-binding protein [Roseinatronobacter sp. S2]